VAFFASSAEVCAAEAELITWTVVDDPLCMNLRDGGEGTTIEGARRLAADPAWRAAMTAAGHRKSSDPKWKARHAALLLRIHADPKWRESQAAMLRRIHESPAWRDSVIAGAAKRSADPGWQKKSCGRLGTYARRPRMACEANRREPKTVKNQRMERQPRCGHDQTISEHQMARRRDCYLQKKCGKQTR
jgi:hypothetical protein